MPIPAPKPRKQKNMIIPQNARLSKLMTDPKMRRPVLEHVYLDGDKLVATDGRALAIVPVVLEDGESPASEPPASCMIDGELVRLAEKVAGKGDAKIALTEKGASVTDKKGAKLERIIPFSDQETVLQYPQYRQVIPDPEKLIVATVSLDAALLLKLAQAMGAESPETRQAIVTLKLTCTEGEEPIQVSTSRNKGAFGVIMPCRVAPASNPKNEGKE